MFYHLPALRRLILSPEFSNIKISKEFDAIRNTFALLKGSKKSWIETKDYVQVFKSHMPAGNTQQVKFTCFCSESHDLGFLRETSCPWAHIIAIYARQWSTSSKLVGRIMSFLFDDYSKNWQLFWEFMIGYWYWFLCKSTHFSVDTYKNHKASFHENLITSTSSHQ